MKELKFRVWGEELKKYVTTIDLERVEKTTLSICDTALVINYLNDISVYDFQIEQYTGLKDNNGKEIYEWDIVRCWNGLDYLDGLVKWSENSAAYFVKYFEKKDCFDEDDWLCDCYCEVIGNVHENPELLEKKK